MEATWKSSPVIESLPYHMHSTCEQQESVHSPGALMWVETRLQCPRCGNEHPPLEHGQAIECPCGLHLQRFGNGLHIWMPPGPGGRHQRCRVLGAARAREPRRNDLRHDAGCGSGLRAARSRRLASARCRAEPAAGALPGRDAPPRDHRDRRAGTTAYALEATVVLDIIHVAAATRRAVLVVGSSKGLSAFGPRPDGSRPAHGDTWLQLRRFSAAAGSRSLDAY